jgi:hypothetical protein
MSARLHTVAVRFPTPNGESDYFERTFAFPSQVVAFEFARACRAEGIDCGISEVEVRPLAEAGAEVIAEMARSRKELREKLSPERLSGLN